MNDWQKGDLALCVNDKPRQHPQIGTISPHAKFVRNGNIYTVSRAYLSEAGQPSLELEGIEVPIVRGWTAGFDTARFRKIRPSAIKHIEALKDVPLHVRENEHA